MWHGHARTGCFGQFRPQQASLLKGDPEKWLCTEPGSKSLDPSHDPWSPSSAECNLIGSLPNNPWGP